MVEIPSDIPEPELIRAAQNGNQVALETLVQRYLPAVYGLSLRYLRHTHDAEDAVQEIFIKTWRNLKKFDTSKNFKAWLMEIAKNTCLDMLKKKQSIPFSAFDTEHGNILADTIASPRPTPAYIAEQSSFSALLATAARKLSPIYRKVLSLYYGDGLNFREISEQLREPLHTVKSRHRRAIIMLKKMLHNT